MPILAETERIAIENLVSRLINVLRAAGAARTLHQYQFKGREAANLQSQVEATDSTLYYLSQADISRAVPIPA